MIPGIVCDARKAAATEFVVLLDGKPCGDVVQLTWGEQLAYTAACDAGLPSFELRLSSRWSFRSARRWRTVQWASRRDAREVRQP